VCDQKVEDNTTRTTARLPGLDIEIIHRRSPNDEAEQISINLQAMPSFEAFDRFLETAGPFALWAQAVQLAWLPWLNVARSLHRSIAYPIEGNCSLGPWPVSATCFIASYRSRRALGIGFVRDASSRPRYCSSSLELKPKKPGVHWAP
jgi:hypothetical protein